MSTLMRFKGRDGFRWHVRASNGRLISGQTEGVYHEEDREDAIRSTLVTLIEDAGPEVMAELGWIPRGGEDGAGQGT